MKATIFMQDHASGLAVSVEDKNPEKAARAFNKVMSIVKPSIKDLMQLVKEKKEAKHDTGK